MIQTSSSSEASGNDSAAFLCNEGSWFAIGGGDDPSRNISQIQHMQKIMRFRVCAKAVYMHQFQLGEMAPE